MECSIYNGTLNRIGIISNFLSLIWSESYTGAGLFQMVVIKDKRMSELLKENNFVGLPGKDTLMYIQSTEDKDGSIWAYGCEAKCLLASRIYPGTIKCQGYVEEALRNAVISAYPYSFIDLAEQRGLTEKTTSQRTYPTLFEISSAWCETVGYGFRLKHDKVSHKLLYDVYEGAERKGIKFAEKFGNLSNLTMLTSEKDWRNVAYVGGSGEGNDRIFVIAGDTTAEGLNRRELYVDARDLQPEEGQSTEEYHELLKARGKEKLLEHNKIIEISFNISSQDFGKSFFLGDKITAVLPEHNIKALVRVAEYKETYEDNTITTELTLGNPIIRG